MITTFEQALFKLLRQAKQRPQTAVQDPEHRAYALSWSSQQEFGGAQYVLITYQPTRTSGAWVRGDGLGLLWGEAAIAALRSIATNLCSMPNSPRHFADRGRRIVGLIERHLLPARTSGLSLKRAQASMAEGDRMVAGARP